MKRISCCAPVIGLFALAIWLYVILPLYYLGWLQAASHPTAATSSVVDECVQTLLGLCFVVPADGKGGIFGFAGFLQAFALLVLIFTVTGTRYQFRVATAPIRLWLLTYVGSALIGALTLISDLWFVRRYPIPLALSSQAYWQFVLGLLFLGMALVWLWFAYISAPKFGRYNAFRFTTAVYRYVMQGVEDDLPVIADELERSAKRIVEFALKAGRQGKRQYKVAEAVCIGTLTFDKDKKQLVKTFIAGLHLTAPTEALDLEDALPDAAT